MSKLITNIVEYNKLSASQKKDYFIENYSSKGKTIKDLAEDVGGKYNTIYVQLRDAGAIKVRHLEKMDEVVDKRLITSVTEQMHKDFMDYCEEKEIIPAEEIRGFIRKCVVKWKKSKG